MFYFGLSQATIHKAVVCDSVSQWFPLILIDRAATRGTLVTFPLEVPHSNPVRNKLASLKFMVLLLSRSRQIEG